MTFYSKFILQSLKQPCFCVQIQPKSIPIQFNSFISDVSKICKKSTLATSQEKNFTSGTTKAQKSIKFRGPFIWNSLCSEIEQSKSIKTI